MKQFEVGRVYSMRSPGDHECVWSYLVIRRTAKTVTLSDEKGKVSTCRISRFSSYNDVETVHPLGVYSLCPSLSADHDTTSAEHLLRLEAYDYMKKNMAPWDWEGDYDNDPLAMSASLEDIADSIEWYFGDDAPAELVNRLRNFREVVA